MLFSLRLLTLILLILVPVIFGDWIRFSIEYFEGRRVSFVCLLTCGRDRWHYHNLAKYASIQNIAISSHNIDRKASKTKELDLCLKQTAPSIGIIINTKCTDFERIMQYASKNAFFDSKRKWFLIGERDIIQNSSIRLNGTYFDGDFNNDIEFINENELETVKVLNKLNLSVDADITLSVKIDDSSFELYEVYNFGKTLNGTFVVESIGDWRIDKGLNINKEFKYYRRWDFRDMVFRTIIVMTPTPPVFDPQMILGEVPDPRVAIVARTSAMIMHEITGIHHFRYNYTIVDRWVGDYVKGHKAVTNSLYFQETDVTPILRFLPDHFDKYDVAAPPISCIETRFYYRIPSQGVGKFENQFLRPLSPGAWWCVVGMCALCCAVLVLSAVVEDRPINVYSWYNSFLSVLALICQQFDEYEDVRRISGARKITILVTGLSCLLIYNYYTSSVASWLLNGPPPSISSLKMTILVTGLWCLLIYNYYTSSVVSWLLNGPPPSINSLWELIDSPLQPLFEDVGYTYSWLQLPDYYYNNKKAKAEDALKKKLKNTMKKGKSVFATLNEGIELVRRGGYAYHAETNAANERISRTFNQRELCDLDSLHSIERVQLYSAVQKNSPYREFFIWSLARLLERGVIDCIHRRTWSHEAKCEGSSPRALALGGAAPAFIVLAAGFVLATLVMIFERLWWSYSAKKRNPLLRNKKQEWWNHL